MLKHKLYELRIGDGYMVFAPILPGLYWESPEIDAARVRIGVSRDGEGEPALLKKLEERGEMFAGMFPTPNQRVYRMVTVSVSDIALLNERLDEKVRGAMFDAMGGGGR